MKRLILTIAVSVLCLYPAKMGQAAVQDGVEVAHCFDDLNDSSGNGHTASLQGGANLSGGMVYFDGNGDYVNVGSGTWSSNPCDGSSNFTIAIAYASSQTGEGEEGAALACIGDPSVEGGSGHLTIFTNNNGQYVDCWYVGAVLGGTQYSGLSYSFSDGNMHCCFITYNASTDMVKLYALDGGSAVAGPSGTLGINTTGSNEYPRLGRAHDDPYNDFATVELNGQISLFAIWNRIISTSEMELVEDLCVPPNPCRPNNPSPANLDEHIDYRNLILDWSVEGGCDPCTTYDVYFGTSSPPPLQASGVTNTDWSCPSPLNIDQWYWWQIKAQVPGDPCSPIEGSEWKFKTGGKAYNPSPYDGEGNVQTSSQLSWSGDSFADSYNVYFGTTPDGGTFQDNTTDPCFTPTLEAETPYYWRIDEVIGGSPQTGDVWSFETALAPPDPEELGFDEILFVQRPSFASDHFYTDFIHYDPDGLFRSDNGIYKYNLTTHVIAPVITAADMPGGQGVFYKFDLDWDASRIVFDYKRGVGYGYRIWMCDIDGSNLTQITTTPPDEAANMAEYDMGEYTYSFHYDDMHPCFTQEDTIIFTSTRCKFTTLCDYDGVLTTPVLHRINIDGTGLEKLTDSPVSEFAPSMMSDGRVVYTRWEYVDKDSLYCKVGYAMNPDGSHVNEIIGLDHHSPPTFNYFRQVPTNPNKFVCVGAPHYWQGDNLGPILLIDRTKEVRTHEEPDDPTPGPAVTYVTPKVHIWQEPGWNFWTGSGWVMDEDGSSGKLYTTPYPLNETQFLVTCKYNDSDSWDTRDAYDIYLIDVSENHIPLVSVSGTSCWNPYPLKTRDKPIKINALKFPSYVASNQGLALVTDVYKGLEGEGDPPIARGDVKYLRVNMVVSRPWSCHRILLWDPVVSSTGWAAALWPRVQLGIVPVEDDGSAYFVVPADRNIFLQALDSEYRELQRERTYINFRPGEFRSCIGCHEQSGHAPTPPYGSSEAVMAFQNPPVIPEPMPGEAAGTGDWAGWGVKVLYYPYDIQPIFNDPCRPGGSCVSCHSGGSPSGDLDLSDGLTEAYNVSYESLTYGGYCGPLVFENNDHMDDDLTQFEPPMYFGCHNSYLAWWLYNDATHRARLTDQELRTIFRWVDTNYQYYGTYYGRHHSDHSSDPDFRRMPTVEEAISYDAPSWHN
ncbi:MAG TPA: hypothetical protein HPP87_00225 [Planctomycetes bacterium]|nr:hypothetical protein [Planctomycetota bacterium]